MENLELKDKYLLFQAQDSYLLPLQEVLEILELPPVTAVPETPEYIAGVTNLRGKILPVVDLRKRLQKEDGSALARRCIVVVEFESMPLGLIVDGVEHIVTLEEGSVKPPPQVGTHYAHVFVKAVGVLEDEVFMILDGEKLIHLHDLSFLEDDHAESEHAQGMKGRDA